MRAQFAKTLLEIGRKDPELFVLVGDIGAWGLREFSAACPGRFVNVGIREQAMASAAAGLAMTGFKPVIHSIVPFVVERCFEQLKDDFGYQDLGGNVVSVGAGFDYAGLGGTHHSYSDLALIRSIPRSQIFIPGSPKEFDVLFKNHYRAQRLNYFRLGGRSHGVDFSETEILDPSGITVQEGKPNGVTLVTSGPLLAYAKEAASSITGASILYLPRLKSLDGARVRAAAARSKRLVIIEDHNIHGGVADEIRQALDPLTQKPEIHSLGVKDEFLRGYGSFDDLARAAGISPSDIVREATR